ncbi:nuclear transport factor 2 family protein [Aquimarina sp. MMG016]|uniref:nuclear transport factor 2 family protein n=1 Tax=Aquimarina sp. MMG016 TaxID=2822690 RepID=UPI001B39EFB1|nr:nuclear transport factor 2 family protein [Aquimarina sp. MMG016]MBQ4819259.1 nuclear transport factor 2 family protein [Aquimarina sp. MMG016]
MKTVCIFLCALMFISCQKPIELKVEKEKVKAQIQLVQEAHYNKNADQFYAPNGDSWYDIRGGQVSIKSKVDAIPGTQSYLNDMVFDELKETHPPVIEISDDGTMASYIGALIVKGKYNSKPVFWVVSWQSVLKKIDGEWKIISTANTEAPKEDASVILDKAKETIGKLNQKSTIYAMANCTGPIGSFKTLVVSDTENGRMEQRTNAKHIILKQGKSNSWTFDILNQKINNTPNELTKQFIIGHEFHWISLRPEDRFNTPVFKEFTEFKGETAFKIEFKDAMKRTVHFYYAFDDYTLLGIENPTDTEENKVRVLFEDWKTIKNIKVFNKVVIEEGDKIWQYDFTDIKINTTLSKDIESKEMFIK